jgi:hypothetical protein
MRTDTYQETMHEFMSKIATAKAVGDEWVETTPEIIKTIQPRGLGGAKFFCYQGVKVCEIGKIEEIEHECSIPQHIRMHPDENIRIISGGGSDPTPPRVQEDTTA